MIPVPIRVTLSVVEILEDLGIPYFLAGSLASSVHGMARTTNDSDLVADLRLAQVVGLVTRLQGIFYVDEQAVKSAVYRRSSFNAIHLETMFKVDIFIPKHRRFDSLQLARRQQYVLFPELDQTIYVASPEDTLLAKLEWYRMGGEISERQWRDILGIISIQGERLDRNYIRQLATELKVADLVDKLFSDNDSSH